MQVATSSLRACSVHLPAVGPTRSMTALSIASCTSSPSGSASWPASSTSASAASTSPAVSRSMISRRPHHDVGAVDGQVGREDALVV